MRKSLMSRILTIAGVLFLSLSLTACSFINLFRAKPTNEDLMNNYEEISTAAGIDKYFTGLTSKTFAIPTSDYTMVGAKFSNDNTDLKNNLISMFYVSEYSAIGFSRFYPLLESNFFKDEKGKSALTKDESLTISDGIKNLKTHLIALDIELEIVRQRDNQGFNPELGSDKNILNKIKTELNGVIDANLSLSHTTLSVFNRILADKNQTITINSSAVIRGSLEADALLDFTSVLTVYNNLFVKKYNNPLWFDVSNNKTNNKVFKLADTIKSVTTSQFEKAESTTNFVSKGVRDKYFTLKQTVGTFFPLVKSINAAANAFPFESLEENVIEKYGTYDISNVYYFVNNQKFDAALNKYVFEANYNVSSSNTQQFYFIKNAFENNFVNGIYDPLLSYFDFISKI